MHDGQIQPRPGKVGPVQHRALKRIQRQQQLAGLQRGDSEQVVKIRVAGTGFLPDLEVLQQVGGGRSGFGRQCGAGCQCPG